MQFFFCLDGKIIDPLRYPHLIWLFIYIWEYNLIIIHQQGICLEPISLTVHPTTFDRNLGRQFVREIVYTNNFETLYLDRSLDWMSKIYPQNQF